MNLKSPLKTEEERDKYWESIPEDEKQDMYWTFILLVILLGIFLLNLFSLMDK